MQFLTGNVHRRIPLFKTPEHCRVLLESLDFCRRKYELSVHGFVIMPDHFHLLVGVPRDGVLSSFLRDWKGFTAHSLVEEWRKSQQHGWLKKFQVTSKRRKDSRFRVFQPDTHVEAIVSPRFARQKLNYIHLNPVRKGLVERVTDYPYSSARNWFLGDQSMFRTDPLEL